MSYTDLFDTPQRRLLVHTLIALLGVGALVMGASQQAGQVRWERTLSEAELEVEALDVAPGELIEVEEETLCLLRLYSPTVYQSWLDVRVRVVGEDGRVVFDERAYLSHRSNLYDHKQRPQGESMRELFVRLPAGRWRLALTAEAPADRARGGYVGGGLKMRPDGQMIWEPGTWLPMPFFPSQYPVARDEVLEVTLTQGAVMMRHGAMLALLAGLLLTFYLLTRSDQTQYAREAHVARVNMAFQAALNRAFIDIAPPAQPPAAVEYSDAPLRFELALGAAILIVLTSAAVVLASVWGLPGPL